MPTIIVVFLDFGTKFKETPKNVVENAGEELKIPCAPPDGYPTPTVDWYKNGEFLNIDGERIKYENDNLIFTKLQGSDTGFYLCRAENAAGKLESEAIKLSVKSKSFFEIKNFVKYVIQQFSCQKM
mgnify:CR=1 FL=1